MGRNFKKFCKVHEPFFIQQMKFSGAFPMQENHYHNSYEIYYLLEGERYYFIKDKTYHVRKGDLVVIDVHELHKTIDAGVPEHERILINFKRGFLDSLLAAAKDLDLLSCFSRDICVLRLNSGEQGFVRSLLNRMVAESKNCSGESEIYLKVLLTELLIFISRQSKRVTAGQAEHPNPSYRKLSDVIAYINSSYMEEITLGALSKRFFISSFHLSRIFREITGFTFVEYLNSVRIKEACRLLTGSRLSVTQISQEVGYNSLTHFGRVFKSITGIPPLRYRKQNTT